jgi:hypothetical protein
MRTVKLKFNGVMMPEYRGFDPVTRNQVIAKKDGVVTVSDVKAAQLLKDFPHDWSHADTYKAPVPVEAPAAEPTPAEVDRGADAPEPTAETPEDGQGEAQAEEPAQAPDEPESASQGVADAPREELEEPAKPAKPKAHKKKKKKRGK